MIYGILTRDTKIPTKIILEKLSLWGDLNIYVNDAMDEKSSNQFIAVAEPGFSWGRGGCANS